MNESERKRWWRFAATAVVGGSLAVAGWIKFVHPATAEPIPNLSTMVGDRPEAEQGVWTRSPNQVCKPAAVSSGDINRSPGAPLQDPGPTVPSILPADVVGGPRNYEAGLIGNPASLPAIPPLPESGAAQPLLPVPNPANPATSAQSIFVPSGSGIPTETSIAPAIPVPSMPTGTESSSSLNIAPTPPPSKLPDILQPVLPSPKESCLPSANEGITVKTEDRSVSGWVQSFPNSPATLPVPAAAQPISPIAPGSLPAIPAVPSVGFSGGSAATVVDRPKAFDDHLPYSEKDAFPLTIPNSTKFFTSGDNPVFSVSQYPAALAIVGGLIAAPVNADTKEEITELQKKVDGVKAQLEETNKKLDRLSDLLLGKKDDKGFAGPDMGIVEEIKRLKDSVAKLDETLRKLETRTTISQRPSAPVPNALPDDKTGKGTVRIVNDYPVEISMVVNGLSYRVGPSQVRDVSVPMGEFTYQLLQAGAAPTTTKIKEKETVTLRVK